MHLVALRQEQFAQVGAILPGDAGNECFFSHGSISMAKNF